ncbi:hypothetical protein Tco_0565771 [Tanacetum coccineum]
METKNTSSSGSVLEEPEIQKLQIQAKIFKENSLNKLNALKSTTQLLERQSILYQQAFAQLFGDSVRTFKFQLSQHMNNLETLLNAETLHEMDSKSALSVIKVQFERFINSDLLKPLDIYSRSFSSDREVKEIFRDYTTMTAQTFKETIIQNMNSIEQCIIERACHEQELQMTFEHSSSSLVQNSEFTTTATNRQELEAHSSYMAKIQEVSPDESSSTDTPLEQVQIHDENDVFANVRRHSEQPESINDTYVLEKDDSNVIPDSSNICTNDYRLIRNAENKTIQKQLKKANASLTQELKECKTNLDETSRALGEATSSRDSSLIALQTKQTELENSGIPNPTAKSMEVLIKILLMPLSDKTILDSHCFVHELKKEMNDDLEYVNSLEKELDELESEKADFSNIYDLLLEECVSKDVTCSYLHSLSDLNANTELQCLISQNVKECECLCPKAFETN